MSQWFTSKILVGDILKLKELTSAAGKYHRFFLILEWSKTSCKIFDMTENTSRSFGTSLFMAIVQHNLEGAWRDGKPIQIVRSNG